MASRGWDGVTASDIAKLQQRSIDKHATPKPSKFRNVKIQTPDGGFDSKKEYAHWLGLKAQQQAGEIRELRRQVKYPLWAAALNSDGKPRTSSYATAKIADYVADFVFIDALGNERIQDVKGGNATKTAVYRLKKSWLEWQSGIEIEEV